MADAKKSRRRKPPRGAPPAAKTDWERLRRTTDANIRRQIAEDPDAAPELDEAWFRSAEVVLPRQKVPISLRLDPEVLTYFKRGGKRYQSRINAVLRAYVRARAR